LFLPKKADEKVALVEFKMVVVFKLVQLKKKVSGIVVIELENGSCYPKPVQLRS